MDDERGEALSRAVVQFTGYPAAFFILQLQQPGGKIPERFTLVLEMESAARPCTVVWRKDRQIGVEFR